MKTLIGIMLIVLGTITWCLVRVADDDGENDENDELQEEKEDNEEE